VAQFCFLAQYGRLSWPSVSFLVLCKHFISYKTSGWIVTSVSSVAKEYSDNSKSCSKVHRPPRIGFPVRMKAAVVHFQRVWVCVAVDRLWWRVITAVGRVVPHTAGEVRPVGCHVVVQYSVHCISCDNPLSCDYKKKIIQVRQQACKTQIPL